MPAPPIETVRSVLASVPAGIDDPEPRSRQLTARQLVDLLEGRAGSYADHPRAR